MSKQRHTLTVGVVTLVVVLTIFLILIWISRRVGGDMRELTVRFKSTPAMPSLVPGSPVLVGGQRVGRIVRASLEPHVPQPSADGPSDKAAPACPAYDVIVHAEIRSDLILRSDCQVVAEGPPLGGDGIVKIDLGATGDGLPPDSVIDGADPGGFGAILSTLQAEFDGTNPGSLLGQIKAQLDPDGTASLMAKLLQSMSDINTLTAALSKELGDAEKETLLAKIHAIADNINMATGALRAEFDTQKPTVLLSKIHLALDSVNDDLATISSVLKTNEPIINRTFQHVETTTENIARETDATKSDSLMAYFKKAGTQLNAALDDINVVTGTPRQVVVLNRENINKLLANFKEASDHIKTGVKYVVRHPWRLLNEPPATEMKQQAIFDAARSFAEAAGQIDDAAAQLRALAEIHQGAIPADSPDLARIQADLKRTQEKYAQAERELWQQLNVE